MITPAQNQAAVIVFDEDFVKENLKDCVEKVIDIVNDAVKQPAVQDSVKQALPAARVYLGKHIKDGTDKCVNPGVKPVTDIVIDVALQKCEDGIVSKTPQIIDRCSDMTEKAVKPVLREGVDRCVHNSFSIFRYIRVTWC